jgi:hypothetical protein
MDMSLIFKSVFALISRIAKSSALWRKFAQMGMGASWVTFPSGILDRLKAEHPAEFLQRNSLGSGPDYFFAQS